MLPDGHSLTPSSRDMLPTADPVTQTVEWRLTLPTTQMSLRPRQSARAASSVSCPMPGTGRDRAVVIAATGGSAGVVDVYVRGAVLPARVCTSAAHSRSAPHGDASASPITLAQYEASVCIRLVSIHQPWPAISHLKSTSASRATRWSSTAGATGAREGGGIDKVRVMAYRVGCGILPTTPDPAAWTTNPVPRMTAMPPQACRAGSQVRESTRVFQIRDRNPQRRGAGAHHTRCCRRHEEDPTERRPTTT